MQSLCRAYGAGARSGIRTREGDGEKVNNRSLTPFGMTAWGEGQEDGGQKAAATKTVGEARAETRLRPNPGLRRGKQAPAWMKELCRAACGAGARSGTRTLGGDGEKVNNSSLTPFGMTPWGRGKRMAASRQGPRAWGCRVDARAVSRLRRWSNERESAERFLAPGGARNDGTNSAAGGDSPSPKPRVTARQAWMKEL